VNGVRGAGGEIGEGPGASLRRARETIGLTEQQAAEQLNLDASAVIALEAGDLAALGAPVFARGHLKRYGALLGLPEEQLLAAYERASTQPEQPSLVPHSRLEMEPARGRPAWPWAVGGTVLFLLAAGLIAYVSEFGLALPGRDAISSAPPVATGPEATVGADVVMPGAAAAPASPVVDAPAATGSPQAAGATVPAVDASLAPATADAGAAAPAAADASGLALVPAPAIVPPGHVSVSVSFAADSWAEIYDGAGQAVLYDLGRAGSQRSISAAAPLSVTLGNAPAVTLVVNGRARPLPALPAGQTVARFTIQPDGTLR
jgi:cytoskeleton protein RodZ